MLYTAQYRYPGQDRLDITVKGNDPVGKIFAPTWGMVRNYKNGVLDPDLYTQQYYWLLIDRWHKGSQEAITDLAKTCLDEDVTVVCFCPAGKFCHRLLLSQFLLHNWAVPYGGERTGF